MDAKKQRAQADEDLRAIMATPAGRRFLMRLMKQAGLHSEPFVPGQGDSTGYNCGRASVGRALLEECMRVDAALYARGQREVWDMEERVALEKQKEREARAESES